MQYQTPPLPLSEEERAQQKITAVIPTKTCQMAYRFPTTPASELHMMTNSRAILITTHDDEQNEWSIALAFASRIVIYVAILALLMMIVALIIKLLGHCDGDASSSSSSIHRQATAARAATETNTLLAKEVVPFTYGTCEEDLESAKCSSSPSDDLYDGKICVICYDERRNCFFIPCGHCATCSICARRITEGETKTCPVCRRYIHKVRKLSIS
ncbi:uncharacterized protein [Coffea arabica]|uniref:Uncharacterized protein isoform X1 n=2 Tax=Coffea arabica TaxID=13443 RepID=A0A6P6T8L2_COFAR